MLHSVAVLIGINLQSSLQGADVVLLSQRNDALLIGMAQNILLLRLLFENIVLHSVISSFRIFVFDVIRIAAFLEGLANHGVDDSLLLFREGVEDVSDRLFALFVLGLFRHFLLLL